MYFIEIKGDSPLAKTEINALCELYECQTMKDFGKVIVVDKFFPFSRLAYSKYACELLSESERHRLNFGALKVISPQKYKKIARKIHGKKTTKSPDSIIIIVEVMDKKGHKKPVVGLQKWKNKSLKRTLKFRCKSALKPELSRFMINLANVKEDETLLDPFCGGGGILIEATVIGINATGFDMSRKMVEGCLKNLHFLGLGAEVHEKNIFEIEPGFKFDSIVTEIPYGKDVVLKGRTSEQFYDFTLHRFSELLHHGRYAVMIAPEELKGTDCMQLIETHKVKQGKKIHYIHVFQNSL